MSEARLFFNGINGATGAYGLPPMTGEALSDHILGIEELQSDDDLASLEKHISREKEGVLGLAEGIDPKDIGQTGWGVIFGAKDALAAPIREALSPLLALRQSQTAFFQVYEKGNGRRPDETARQFLARHGVDLSKPADPANTGVPYYLLIVGSPGEIPYRFQYQLDVEYAVGRIDFGDDMEAYANYARSVVQAETGGVALERKASFFGVANPDDEATNLSADHLVRPLHASLAARHPDWQMDATLREEATKARLLRLIGGEDPPALLFTATHGMEFPIDDPKKRQVLHQGALLCQEWPGPNAWRGEIPQDFYLAADDLAGQANLLGLMAFFFACYGAGTPIYDEFSKQAFKERREVIAEHPFVAALPTALLSRPKGGALAVIGHVERAWGNTFMGPNRSEQITVFESTVERLLNGHPVGSAMEYFNGHYAALSTQLTGALEDIDFGGKYDPYELAAMWTANNDARGYIVIGDPAARLPVATSGKPTTGRPDIEGKPVEISAPATRDSAQDAQEATLAKPAGISDADWEQTPPSVKKYVKQLEDELRKSEMFGTLGSKQ